jgi:vancomycin permeability regulator SanA
MKKTRTLLMVGDTLAILTFLFLSYLLNVPGTWATLLNLGVMAVVVALIWGAVRDKLDAADFRNGFFRTAYRTLIAWSISALLISLARHVLITLTHPAFALGDLSLFAIFFTFLGGGFFLALWRSAFYFTWRILHLPKEAFLRKLSLGTFWLFIILLLASGPLRLTLILRYNDQIIPEDEVAPTPAALIFGAGVWRSGTPSRVLVDRVRAGVRLYQAGKVQVLLMSGGGREPEVMRSLAIEAGVPDEAILLDDSGLDTCTSCQRAQEVFGFDDVLLVTQRFHLPRALFLCEDQGLSARGVAADLPGYTPNGWLTMQLREFPAVAKAVLEVWLDR